MKRKFIIYIITILFISNSILFSFIRIYENYHMKNFIDTEEKKYEAYLISDIKYYLKENFLESKTFLIKKVNEIENELINLNKISKTRSKWNEDELNYINKNNQFEDIIIFNKNNKVVFSSNEKKYLNKNISSILSDHTNYYFNKLKKQDFYIGDIFFENTQKKVYSIYRDKNFNIIIGVINLDNYLNKEFYPNYFKNNILKKIDNYKFNFFLKYINIYDGKNGSSLINDKNINLVTLNEIKNKGKLSLDEKNWHKKYILVSVDREGFIKNYILETHYDFSILSQYTNELFLVLVIEFIILIIVFVFLSSIIFNNTVTKKMEHIISNIEELKKGNYNIHDINLISQDEISSIATEINRLKKEVISREKKLIKYAVTDELTKVYNRKFIFLRLKELIDRNIPFSIALIDLDHFKQVNDKYGHQMGDKILHEFAKLLKKFTTKNDIVGRYGGEEFIIILPHKNIVESYLILEDIQTYLNKKPLTHKINITMSVGITEFIENIDKTIAKADELLYYAKANGRNRIEVENNEKDIIQ
ncbi:diguanylate cyclase (GGDEF)-like protein [Hypnocyclicus thermotrophus]|uniref:Diguanylate cyclase (GGDEF)-like protein n=1 Tax=Hypnocyclicus thermotrophus TaxID=1627895 RepID=A0AA46I6F0_9FUSO|nr:diguanylate cyclase [Hypnocyclicus thermotrophus]TDT72474.1 diguanylate cyclase (GGDEF)-like protein [Hypnocyclicus thermotrophus]